MNAEALVGKTLGTATLLEVIGQGSTGAVFLAGWAQGQVAVKVLLPGAFLPAGRQSAFLKYFRREAGLAASLEHPHIIPIYEHGVCDGLAYLVMPYIGGGTLNDLLEREGPLELSKALGYLEQVAMALDFAHEHGVIHRDIKPAAILMTAQGHLLLTDIVLSSVLPEMFNVLSRRSVFGSEWSDNPRVHTWERDYLAPEQVLGKQADKRVDLYSLGVLLYHMLTGTTPFAGIKQTGSVTQHVYTPPHPPRTLRSDIPQAVEQVILRAIAKQPADRYASGHDLVTALRTALEAPVSQADDAQPALPAPAPSGTRRIRPFKPRTGGLFDPKWQAAAHHTRSADQATAGSSSVQQAPLHLLAASPPANVQTVNQQSPQFSGQHERTTSELPPVDRHTSGMLALRGYEQVARTTAILTEPVKVVRVPIPGQPGQFVTGMLPVLPSSSPLPSTTPWPSWSGRTKMLLLIVMVALLVLGSAAFWFVQSHSVQTTKLQHAAVNPAAHVPDVQATAQAQATATAAANIILWDPLNVNIHNWLTGTQNSNIYAFQDGSYHITNNAGKQVAPAILPEVPAAILNQPFVYTLTMQEIKGDDTSVDNSFGMIIRFSQQESAGKHIITFYSFEVVNKNGGEYQLWKYDSSKGASPWTKTWHTPFGAEFHQGHAANTFRIIVHGNTLIFVVNGKRVGAAQASSVAGGAVGMLVNLKGTEVAFSNLELTHS